MPRMSLVLAFTQSCPSSSLDQKMVKRNSSSSRFHTKVHPVQVIFWVYRSLLQLWLPPPSLGTVRIWHSSTYRLESTLNYGMERVWCVCGLRGSNNVALGYDEGSIIIKVSKVVQEKPRAEELLPDKCKKILILLSIFLLLFLVFCVGWTGGTSHVYGHERKDHLG